MLNSCILFIYSHTLQLLALFFGAAVTLTSWTWWTERNPSLTDFSSARKRWLQQKRSWVLTRFLLLFLVAIYVDHIGSKEKTRTKVRGPCKDFLSGEFSLAMYVGTAARNPKNIDIFAWRHARETVSPWTNRNRSRGRRCVGIFHWQR